MQPPVQEPIGRDLARTAKLVGQHFDAVLGAEGGSQAVWMVLISLKTHPRANQREIARAAGIQGATLTHHLNAMEGTGWVTRRRDPANRRVHVLELTQDGEAVFERLAKAAIAFDRQLRAGMPEGDLAAARRVLAKLRQNVEQ
ncbi:MAG: MarR family winged helix-turn-helix transcriptional regulator [Acidimicrobiales bacterium]